MGYEERDMPCGVCAYEVAFRRTLDGGPWTVVLGPAHARWCKNRRTRGCVEVVAETAKPLRPRS
jgi:hypothetical protein